MIDLTALAHNYNKLLLVVRVSIQSRATLLWLGLGLCRLHVAVTGSNETHLGYPQSNAKAVKQQRVFMADLAGFLLVIHRRCKVAVQLTGELLAQSAECV